MPTKSNNATAGTLILAIGLAVTVVGIVGIAGGLGESGSSTAATTPPPTPTLRPTAASTPLHAQPSSGSAAWSLGGIHVPFTSSAAPTPAPSRAMAGARYSETEALLDWKYCRLAYCSHAEIEAVAGEYGGHSNLLYSDEKEVLVYLQYDEQAGPHGVIRVVFRGTQTPLNWMNNARQVLIKPTDELHQLLEPGTFPAATAYIHAGFNYNMNALFGLGLWDQFERLRDAHPSAAVRVTGHSLGGAEGTLFTAVLVNQGLTTAEPRDRGTRGVAVDVELYTFGSPRVADGAFARWFNDAVATDPRLTAFRVTHHRDPVPSLPSHRLWYKHVTREIFYKDAMTAGAYRECNGGGEDPTCHRYYTVTATASDHSYWGWSPSCAETSELLKHHGEHHGD